MLIKAQPEPATLLRSGGKLWVALIKSCGSFKTEQQSRIVTYSIFLTIKHWLAIVFDKRVAFEKNTRRFYTNTGYFWRGKNFERMRGCSNKCLKCLQFISSDIEYLMVFPEPRSTENYAMKNPAIASDLSQLSLCFFIKLVQDQGDQMVVSYATVNHPNDILREVYPTRTDFYVGNELFR